MPQSQYMQSLIEKHRPTLDRALVAITERSYWSAFSESPSPKVYGEGSAEAGKAAFEALLGKPYVLEQSDAAGMVGQERSPYGFDLGIQYPKQDLKLMFEAVKGAHEAWRKAGPDIWAAVSIEILTRLNAQSFLMANAVMHTTGQAFMMAFQAAGPHAQDRGLEAVAYACAEMQRVPAKAYWEKPQGKNDPLRMEKTYRVVPRGIALVIGCCTFPTWNGYPGLFASLATGNAVVLKPHPGAILPLAITARVAREVLVEAGFAADIVTLVAHDAGDVIPEVLALHPDVKLIDFTGSPAHGRWLEHHVHQAVVFTEKAGVNQVVIDGTGDLAALARNLAFSLALYSGQMCTAPQNIYVPATGIDTPEGHRSFDEVAAAITGAVQKLLEDPARAVEILGAIQNESISARIDEARKMGSVLLDSVAVVHPAYPEARIRTPLIIKLTSAERDKYLHEWFGPIAFIVATRDTPESLAIARDAVREHGALTFSVYATDDRVIDAAIAVAEETGVALSINLLGGVFVNQSAAYSDYHGTGANPAANSALTDTAFVANRFRVVQHRRHV